MLSYVLKWGKFFAPTIFLRIPKEFQEYKLERIKVLTFIWLLKFHWIHVNNTNLGERFHMFHILKTYIFKNTCFVIDPYNIDLIFSFFESSIESMVANWWDNGNGIGLGNDAQSGVLAIMLVLIRSSRHCLAANM